MQDMTSEICKDNSVATGSTKQLKDSRDQKYYWVAKLADGNCWMTQNLDFDIPDTLSSTDTNIKEDIIGTTKTVTTNTIKVATPDNWPANNDNPKYNAYYDPDDYIYDGPSNKPYSQSTACSVNNSDADALASCMQFTKTVTNTSAFGNIDAHYHIGNYYSWSAAAIKSGDDLASGLALDSICPKGWRLPTGNASGQFAELLTKYSVNSNLAYGDYAIYKKPLYFVYGGFLTSSALKVAGNFGYYWSSTVNADTGAFRLLFYSEVVLNGGNPRYEGSSVRCVAE